MATSSQSKQRWTKSARRREELRRTLPRPVLDVRALFRRPEFMTSLGILLSLAVGLSGLVWWSRGQIKLRDGQIMTETRVNRLDFSEEDVSATEARRAEARKAAARIYNVNSDYLSNLRAALHGLPAAVGGETEIGRINASLVREFDLGMNPLEVLHQVASEREASRRWNDAVDHLTGEQLLRTPLLESREFQEFSTATQRLLINDADGETMPISRTQGIEIPSAASVEYLDQLRDLALRSGFGAAEASIIVSKLHNDAKPTMLFNPSETTRGADREAAQVRPVIIQHRKGEVIYSRGDRLRPEQIMLLEREHEQFTAHASAARVWWPRLGVMGLMMMCVGAAGTFGGLNYPRITRNVVRVAALSALLAASVGTAAVVTANAPIFLYPIAMASTLFTAILVLIAYDQKLAVVVGSFHALLNALALEQSPGFTVLLVIGVVTVVFQLREVRHRNSLLRGATWTAAALGAGTILLGLVEYPLVADAWRQTLVLAAAAVAISYGVCFLILGILPTVERMFDITTGMTLAELRDPRQPLLRQLQQRAPGTYNHSLQVANLAESAADAINADSLLVYVGAMYHDIGKMNKPEYFVENQARGANKHEKLSPAMSLLVIIGHIKDGIELAREYSLPRDVQHFIESHHGTTLVEYFYHAAKTKADESDDAPVVSESEYRYPGPKPQTREAAILMLADAVESATRTLAEPNPARIESLVRRLSRKRLDDGQFDECDLTFSQLARIEEAMIQRLCAIHHSRISYPSDRAEQADQQPPRPQPKPISA